MLVQKETENIVQITLPSLYCSVIYFFGFSMNLIFTVPLRKKVKKLSLILADEVDFEAPKDTQIQSPTTVTVL